MHHHIHNVVVDGVFDADAVGGVIFHPASELDARASEMVHAGVWQRRLRKLASRGLWELDEARTMAVLEHGGGISVDVSVRIQAADPAGLERLFFPLRAAHRFRLPRGEASYCQSGRQAWAMLLSSMDEVSKWRASSARKIRKIAAVSALHRPSVRLPSVLACVAK